MGWELKGNVVSKDLLKIGDFKAFLCNHRDNLVMRKSKFHDKSRITHLRATRTSWGKKGIPMPVVEVPELFECVMNLTYQTIISE